MCLTSFKDLIPLHRKTLIRLILLQRIYSKKNLNVGFEQELALFITTNNFWRESLKSLICLLLKLSKNGLHFSSTKAKMPRRDNFWGGFSPFLDSSKDSLLKMPNLLSDFSQNVVRNNAKKNQKRIVLDS